MPINPLLLPEILFRLAYFVPCWDKLKASNAEEFLFRPDDQYLFSPNVVLACASVCRLWYPIFYSQLWIVYDGEIMSPISTTSRRTRSLSYRVPEAILLAQSPLFRVLTRYNGQVPSSLSNIASLRCRQLVDLTLHRTCPLSCHLVQTNGATLRRLTWYGNVAYSGMVSDLESHSMKGLTGLERLSLTQWDVSNNRLIPTLEQNKGSLQEMALTYLLGLDFIPKGLKMEKMRVLALDGEWNENAALMDVIKACPNLEKLTLEWTLVELGGAQLVHLKAHLLDRRPPLKAARGRAGSIMFVL